MRETTTTTPVRDHRTHEERRIAEQFPGEAGAATGRCSGDGGGLMILTTAVLNPQHPAAVAEWRDLCRMHARVLDMTLGMPDGPRVLWAQIPRGGRRVLLVRATGPVTADRLPRGYVLRLGHRLWQPPGYGRHRVALVCAPVRQDSATGRRVAIVDRAEQERWLRERLEPMIDRLRVGIVGERVLAGWHRERRRVVHRLVQVELTGEVTDPGRLAELAVHGFGRARAYGGGLSIWEKL